MKVLIFGSSGLVGTSLSKFLSKSKDKSNFNKSKKISEEISALVKKLNESQKNLKIVDLTGAGDLFAAGFLHGYINKKSMKESLIKGTEMASKIIQTIGARLNLWLDFFKDNLN